MSIVRRTAALLLVAVLASGMFSCPAYRHTHPMSEHAAGRAHKADCFPARSHAGCRHSHSPGHGHRHSHTGRSHEHSKTCAVADEKSATGGDMPVEHVHLAVFGFSLTMPVMPDGSPPPTNSEGEWVPVSGESGMTLALSHPGAPNFAAVPYTANRLATLEVPPRAASIVPPEADSLCDTARLERSGVLTI